jgi:hypothetical protein
MAAEESKQQGIIETAQAAANDPQSQIQPELVEQKLVEESRKAGSVAIQFDPNDSPEDKANLASSVSINQNPKIQKKIKNRVIITDTRLSDYRHFLQTFTIQIRKKEPP